MQILHYQRQLTRDIGTPDNPETETYMQEVALLANGSNYAVQMAQAQAESYNGAVTVEDVPDVPQAPTQLDAVEARATYTAMMTNTMLEG